MSTRQLRELGYGRNSAAKAHRVGRLRQIHVTAPTERRQRRGFRVHFAPLTTADLARIERIPITSLARTQLDLAAILPTPRLERALERSEELQLFDLHELEAVLGRYSHHPGSKPSPSPRHLQAQPRLHSLRA